MIHFLLVALGGFFGSILRFYIAKKANKRLLGTWIANITGSVVLGILISYYYNGELSKELWLLLGVGFCGAYTTFSTFGNETLQLLFEKRYGLAFTYVISSITISLLAVLFAFLVI